MISEGIRFLFNLYVSIFLYSGTTMKDVQLRDMDSKIDEILRLVQNIDEDLFEDEDEGEDDDESLDEGEDHDEDTGEDQGVESGHDIPSDDATSENNLRQRKTTQNTD